MVSLSNHGVSAQAFEGKTVEEVKDVVPIHLPDQGVSDSISGRQW